MTMRWEGTRGWLILFRAARRLMLGAYVLTGRLARVPTRGTWPFMTLVVFAFAVPLGMWSIWWLFGTDPDIADFVNAANVIAVFFVTALLQWIDRARKRVVVEPFVDHTGEEDKAVRGLATVLVTELVRLSGLYDQVNELSMPTAAGVETQGGFDRAKEAAALLTASADPSSSIFEGGFLTVSTDGASSILEDGAFSDASIAAGPVRIPLGPVLAAVNRLTRGPRVVGAVHLTEAGRGPTLTAQLIGGRGKGTWRVDAIQEPESWAERQASLDTMVRELACRMFAELTLGGNIGWRAVHAFNEYLELYGAARRTPRDRARFLKQAQSKLMAALAEDERFDLAYYNLGVTSTLLAQEDVTAARLSHDDATSPANLPRARLAQARRDAARVAFTRATDRSPERWEAWYALAVTQFSSVQAMIDIVDPPPESGLVVERLTEVILCCDQVLQVGARGDGSTALALDLRGMAQTRLAQDFSKALGSHRRAVVMFWREYCRARRRSSVSGARDDRAARDARTNTAAALSNLALAYERRARAGEVPEDRLSRAQRADLETALRVFDWAIGLAGEGGEQAAACHFERGVVLDRLGRHLLAAREYELAKQIHPSNCEYAARRAVSLARHASLPYGDSAIAALAVQEARLALRTLAGPFSAATSPFSPNAVRTRVEATLAALETARLVRGERGERIARIDSLRRTLESCRMGADPTPSSTLARLYEEFATDPDGDAWELLQIELARGRLAARQRDWPTAEAIFGALVARLDSDDSVDRFGFGVDAEYARALRERGRYREALNSAAECVRREPLNVDGRREAGRAHFALQQYDDALASWNLALWHVSSDPYLHYEVGMCHRRLAALASGEACEHELASAVRHFEHAQELFDGEDLDGDAWMRVWLGRTALERGDAPEAIRRLLGAEHGGAAAAAALFLGEALLARDAPDEAEHAFARCAQALEQGRIASLPGRDTIDAGWGDELPSRVVKARLELGLAAAREARCGWTDDADELE